MHGGAPPTHAPMMHDARRQLMQRHGTLRVACVLCACAPWPVQFLGTPSQDRNVGQGVGYVVALFAATCLQSLASQHYFILQQAVGQRMGAVLKAAVLDHMMGLPSAAQAGSDGGTTTALLGTIDHLRRFVHALNVGLRLACAVGRGSGCTLQVRGKVCVCGPTWMFVCTEGGGGATAVRGVGARRRVALHFFFEIRLL